MHCQNKACHVLFICCQKCKEKLANYCSKVCQICDKFPKKINQFLVGADKQKHQNQYKKYYKKSKIII